MPTLDEIRSRLEQFEKIVAAGGAPTIHMDLYVQDVRALVDFVAPVASPVMSAAWSASEVTPPTRPTKPPKVGK